MTAESPDPAPRTQPSRRLFAAALVGRTANEMTSVAIVLLVLGRGQGAVLAGITAGALALPGIVTGPVLGALLDRSRHPLRVIAAEQAVGAAGLLALAILVGHIPTAATIALATVTGVLQPLSTGGMTSILTGLSSDEFVPRATSVEAASVGAATVAGPLLAAVLVAAAGGAAAVLVQSALKLVAMAATLTTAEASRPATPLPGTREPLAVTVAAGFRHFAAAGPLAAITVCGAVAMAGRGLLTLAFPFFAVEALGRGQDFAGVLWGAFAAGSALGAIGLSPRVARWPSGRVAIGGVALTGLAMLPISTLASTPVTLALLGLSGLVYGPSLAATFDVRRRATPAAFLGQIFTTAASAKTASFALGAVFSGAIVATIGADDTIALAAVMHLAASAIGATLMEFRPR